MNGKVITCYYDEDGSPIPNDEVLHFEKCDFEYKGWYGQYKVSWGKIKIYKLSPEELEQYILKFKNKFSK